MTSLGSSLGAIEATHVVPAEPVGDVSFFIPGIPIPQGSKKGFIAGKRVVIVDDNAATLKPWRAVVAKAANRGMTLDGPVHADLLFVMPRPQKPRWDVPAVKPDIDKLTRAIFDGLTEGGLLADDARVTRMVVEEVYASPISPVGVHVTVTNP